MRDARSAAPSRFTALPRLIFAASLRLRSHFYPHSPGEKAEAPTGQ